MAKTIKTPKKITAEFVLSESIRWLENDNLCMFAANDKQRAAALKAIQTMLDSGWNPLGLTPGLDPEYDYKHDLAAFTGGEYDDQLHIARKWKGGKAFHKILNEVFDNPGPVRPEFVTAMGGQKIDGACSRVEQYLSDIFGIQGKATVLRDYKKQPIFANVVLGPCRNIYSSVLRSLKKRLGAPRIITDGGVRINEFRVKKGATISLVRYAPTASIVDSNEKHELFLRQE